jgi:hypothetical protein
MLQQRVFKKIHAKYNLNHTPSLLRDYLTLQSNYVISHIDGWGFGSLSYYSSAGC